MMLLLAILLFCASVVHAQPTGTRPHAGYQRVNKLAVQNQEPCPANNVVTGWLFKTDPRCQQIALSWLSDSANVLTNTSTHIVENKQVVPREVTLTVVSDTVTPNIDNGDDFVLNAISAPLTIANPMGTGSNPRPGQEFSLCLFSTTPRGLTFGSDYAAEKGIPLPTTTTGDGTIYDCYKFKRNAHSSKWGLVASTQNTGTQTVYPNLPLTGIKLHPTLPTGPSVSGATTVIWFDDTTTECILWEWAVPGDYVGSPVFRLWYTMLSDTNTAHNAKFDVQVWALKAGQDVHTPSFDATVNHCDDSNIPATVGTWNDIGCALTANDGMAANDPVQFQVCSDVTGTWTGDMGLVRARFEYAK